MDEAVRALVRVGLDDVVGYVTPETLAEFVARGGHLVRTAEIDMAQMETQRLTGKALVLDVRGGAEFAAGHVPGAIHIPHTRVRSMLETIPSDTRILVHCNSGARAAAAVSVLERHGVHASHVNDLWTNYRQAAQAVDAQS